MTIDDFLMIAEWLCKLITANGIMAGATIFLAAIAALTYNLSRRAELDRRPWVTVDARMIDGLQYEGDNIVARFDLLFTNVGKTPAVNVRDQRTPFVIEVKSRPEIEILAEKTPTLLHAILPGETLSLHFPIKIPSEKVRAIADENGGKFKIGAVIHVFYQGRSEKARRSTHRAFSIYRSDRQPLTVDKLPLRPDELYLKTEGSKAAV